MKYPYIGKVEAEGGSSILVKASKNVGYVIKNNLDDTLEDVWEGGYSGDAHITNITTEYLANTYGEVKSKAHAEFIVKLAENHGYTLTGAVDKSNARTFVIDGENKLLFFMRGSSSFDGSTVKKITIPLPPESNVNTPEEDFEMKQIEKNNGDNLIFGGDDKCKEWPCVNDEVLINIDFDKYDIKYGKEVNGENGVVRSIFKDGDATVYVVSVDGTCYCFVRGLLSEPKTQEEKGRDEIEKYFKELFRVVMSNPLSLITGDADKAIDHIFENLEIKKKPQ